MNSVFLSYSSKDKAFVHRLAEDLKSKGVTVWLDNIELKIGDSLFEKIGKAIDKVDFLAVIISKNSVKSEWVKREVNIVLNDELENKRVRLLPLLLDNCLVPPFLRGKLFADFRNANDYEAELSKLLDRIGVGSSKVKQGTVIFDQSCRQNEWYGKPIADAGYSQIFKAASEKYNVVINGNQKDFSKKSLDSNTSHSSQPWSNKLLSSNSILVLPQPFGYKVGENNYETLVNWVNRGGGLLLLSIYLRSCLKMGIK